MGRSGDAPGKQLRGHVREFHVKVMVSRCMMSRVRRLGREGGGWHESTGGSAVT